MENDWQVFFWNKPPKHNAFNTHQPWDKQRGSGHINELIKTDQTSEVQSKKSLWREEKYCEYFSRTGKPIKDILMGCRRGCNHWATRDLLERLNCFIAISSPFCYKCSANLSKRQLVQGICKVRLNNPEKSLYHTIYVGDFEIVQILAWLGNILNTVQK